MATAVVDAFRKRKEQLWHSEAGISISGEEEADQVEERWRRGGTTKDGENKENEAAAELVGVRRSGGSASGRSRTSRSRLTSSQP